MAEDRESERKEHKTALKAWRRPFAGEQVFQVPIYETICSEDQWLLPMIEELVADYAIDGIHHDYVRYCGDVAPDSYCFCDYCLKQIPRHALLQWETGPKERQRIHVIERRVWPQVESVFR